MGKTAFAAFGVYAKGLAATLIINHSMSFT